jgi:aryl carrier-like protein
LVAFSYYKKVVFIVNIVEIWDKIFMTIYEGEDIDFAELAEDVCGRQWNIHNQFAERV